MAVGIGPFPPEAQNRRHLPGIRLWSIVQQLVLRGHPVRLTAVRFDGRPFEHLYVYDLSARPRDSGAVPIDLPKPHAVKLEAHDPLSGIQRLVEQFGPDALIGCMDVVNRYLGRLATSVPMWLDYPGDPMAERQMLSRLWGDDRRISEQWESMTAGLVRADRVSGCSVRQVGALLGQLSAVGRLNRFTAEVELVHHLPPWFTPAIPSPSTDRLLRGVHTPPDAFIVLQTGGFNTWLDEETLFESMELAMSHNDRIHFVATGGALIGHDEKTFESFRRRVADSVLQKRFHLLGWVPSSRIARIMGEADAGLNVDLPSVEGWLGQRYRLIEWMSHGLTVISTIGSELAESASRQGVIFGVPQGDVAAISDAICRAAQNHGEVRDRGRLGRKYVESHFSADDILRPLFDWCRDPRRAPDLMAWSACAAHPPEVWSRAISEAGDSAELDRLRIELERTRVELGTLRGSSLVQAALWLRRRLGRKG